MRTDEPRPIRLEDYTPSPYLIDEVSLDVALDPSRTVVRSKLSVRKRDGVADAPLVLNGEDLELIEVRLNNRALEESEYERGEKSLTLPDPGEACVLEITTACAPKDNTALSGLYLSGDMLCTQCEAEGFRRITYFLDRPDNLATYSVRMEGDKSAYPVLLANGNPDGEGDLEDGRHWAAWRDPFPKPSYLFAMVAGDLACVEDSFKTQSGRDVTLRIFVQPKNHDKCAYAMDALKRSMKWDEEAFGREYDLDLFMIVAVDHFNFGAMENKGLNIFNSAYVLAKPETATDRDYELIESVVAHEYFHNWSGNRVTCRDWFQLCLKEGFTVFRDQEFSADMRSRAVQRAKDVAGLRASQFPEDAGPLAHPVRPQSFITIDNFYTATVYEKGAELIRMLKTVLGAKAFRAGCDLYFERHDGEAATVDNFLACMREASDTDLTQFERWYDQAGAPYVHVEDQYEPQTQTYRLTLSQRTAPTPGQPQKSAQQIPVRMGLLSDSGEALNAQLAGDAASATEWTLDFTSDKKEFVFEGVRERPIASLFRAFSAPIVLERDQSVEDRLILMQHDPDLFNRWDTARAFELDLLAEGAGAPRFEDADGARSSFVAALKTALESDLEPALLSEMLVTSSDSQIAQTLSRYDPDAVYDSRRSFRAYLAGELKDTLYALYERFEVHAPYSPDAEQAGKRALRNAALDLLLALETDDAAALAAAQLKGADNMTDAAAALRALAHSARPEREAALAAFYDQWKDDALVVNKWFAWQASAPLVDALDRVKALTQHEAFDLTNPNRARSVIGVFANQNLVRFHASNGAGYEFLFDHIDKLDSLNPQIAARLLGSLEQAGKLDADRQARIRDHLERLLTKDKLSSNVFEMATRLKAAI